MIKKPTSMTQFIGFILAILGASFLFMGILTNMGLLSVSSNSKGDPAIIFPVFGAINLFIGGGAYFVTKAKEKQRKQLVSNGFSIVGNVIQIKKFPFTQWGTQNPYALCVSYTYSGKTYERQSELLWDEPTLVKHNEIVVYIDENNPSHCAIL